MKNRGQNINLFHGMTTNGEGNISHSPRRMSAMKELLIKYKPRNIITIGFNLGHSCKHIIDTLESIEGYKGVENYYVFDICEVPNDFSLESVFNNKDRIGGGYKYVKPNFEIFKRHYPHINLQLIPGDSRETVKPFLDDLNIKFDFIEIDGSHEVDVPKIDIESTINHVNENGIIYLDDYVEFFPAVINAIKDTEWDKFNFETNFDDDIFWAVKKVIKNVKKY